MSIKGPSGSGKSTIVGLLERWYNPASGTITLDGKDIKDLNLTWLRTNIRLVQQVSSSLYSYRLTLLSTADILQEPVLFNGSVFDNVTNGLVGTVWETASREEQMKLVEEAAKLAFAHDFIIELPQGYDTRIGERGGLLSGGQKQRIAIARSIISRPKILLLDEATSALDPHAEGIVQKALDSASQNRTTIVIAHKLATIRNADNIVVLSKGKIMEQGRHDDLVARNGVYSTLVKAQDLSPSGDKGDMEKSREKESEVTNMVEHTQSLAMIGTVEQRSLASLRDREDHDLYSKSGIIHAIYRLVRSTPELKFWYILTAVSCLAGCMLSPHRTIMLHLSADIF